MNEIIERIAVYNEGYAAGVEATLEKIDDILAACPNDNAALLVKMLKELRSAWAYRKIFLKDFPRQ